jgi:hypothetical protein
MLKAAPFGDHCLEQRSDGVGSAEWPVRGEEDGARRIVRQDAIEVALAKGI